MSDAGFAEAMYDEIYGLNCTIGQLTVENAKLRQLVEDMLDCIEIRVAWHRPLTDEMCDEFAQRARELGVEV